MNIFDKLTNELIDKIKDWVDTNNYEDNYGMSSVDFDDLQEFLDKLKTKE